jgi:hypothetical protein
VGAAVVQRSRRGAAFLVATALVAGGLFTGAADAQACPVQPLLRDVTIGQGLPYSNGTATNSVLVSGKRALVRFYLSEQECGDKDMLLNSANLILNGNTAEPIAAQQTLVPGAPISNHATAPAINSTGDPLFLVPASRLSGTMSFRVDITFTPKGGSTLSSSLTTLGGATIQRRVHTATAPMRILAIPMGDGRYLFPDAKNDQVPQLSTAGIENATAGFTALSRTYPVADGTGTLGVAGGGGVRYFLNEGGLVNVNSYLGDGDGDGDKDATYCDGGFLSRVVPELSDFRLNFNTIGNAEPAARVLGLLDEGLSDPSLACSRGRAVMGGREAWVRTLTGRTGALMAMEEAHNFGTVPDSRDGSASLATHATQDQADQFNASFVDRGYNLADGRQIANDRTALKYFETGWDDTNVLLEKLDWDMIFCKQGGPTTTNSDCSVSGSSGAVPAVAPVTAIVGSTDFSAAGTSIFDSFTAEGFPTEEPESSSRLRLKELASDNSVLSDRGVPFAALNTLHHHNGNSAEHGHSFGLTIPTHPDATAWQLVDASDGEVLATGSESALPVIESMTATQEFPRGCVECTDYSAMLLDDEERFNPDQAERIDFESGYESNGDTITDHYASQGVVFDDPDDGTPRIVGDCEIDGAPCRAGWETSSPTRTLYNNTQLPDGHPNSGPLTMRFPVPVRKVGMYMGNGGTQTVTGPDLEEAMLVATTATLTLYNSDDEIIGTHSKGVNEDVDTFIGFDAGESAIAKATLNYFPPTSDESGGPTEAIDDLMFEDFAESRGSTVEVRASDPDGVGALSATFFADCGDVTVPIAVNQPANTDGSFSYRYDSENICADGGQATISVRVDDGYSTATETTTVESSADHDPVAAISAPADGAKILEHSAIKVQGAGNDFEDGALPGSQLSWTISGPGVSHTGTGTDLNLPAPANGWTPGDYVATITATDSDGNSQSTTADFRVLTDADNDGVTQPDEACAGGSDANPFDNDSDGDKDGYPNRDDSAPCTAEAKYDALLDFDPDTVNLAANGQTVKFDVRLRYRNVAEVVGPTVKITKIDGVKVEDLTPSAGPPGGIPNLSWEVKKGVGTAKFDRQMLSNLLLANGIYDKNVSLTLSGSGATLVGVTTQSWGFEGSDFPRIMKKG